MSEHPIGALVRIDCQMSPSGYHGRVCRVASRAHRGHRLWPNGRGIEEIVGQEVDLVGINGRPCFYTPDELVPLYDNNQLTEWSDCAWQPTKARV